MVNCEEILTKLTLTKLSQRLSLPTNGSRVCAKDNNCDTYLLLAKSCFVNKCFYSVVDSKATDKVVHQESIKCFKQRSTRSRAADRSLECEWLCVIRQTNTEYV